VFEASERPAEDPQPPLSAAAALADADVTTLDLDGTLDALATWQRAAACAEYGLLETAAHYADLCGQPPVAAPDKGRERLVRLGGEGTPQVEEFASTDLAAPVGMSTGRATMLIADALDLRHRLPGVYAALQCGDVEGWRARLVARLTRALNASLAARVEAEILPRLSSVTVTRLRRLVAEASSRRIRRRRTRRTRTPAAIAASRSTRRSTASATCSAAWRHPAPSAWMPASPRSPTGRSGSATRGPRASCGQLP